MKPIAELAPIARISLFVFSGWLQGQGVDSQVVTYIKTDPEVLSVVVLILTGAWYTLAKIKDWKR
jgi:hypothetical protein